MNLRRKDIARELGVCLRVVDELIREKAFPSFKIRGQRLARYEDVRAYNDSLARAADR